MGIYRLKATKIDKLSGKRGIQFTIDADYFKSPMKTVTVAKRKELEAAVEAFAKEVAENHPDTTYEISVSQSPSDRSRCFPKIRELDRFVNEHVARAAGEEAAA